jgi:3-oxoacyl-[acyl-carrier protein] reductase
MMMKMNDWQDVLDINLSATFLLNQLASKVMLKNKFGRIINIASVVGVTGNPGQANYVASKAGMIGFSKSIAAELATRNITVNCIAPGFIESPMTDKLSDTQKDQIAKKIPMQRMGRPEEIAHGVLFLASEQSSYITGNTLHINGGMFMS